ncbi:response regulator transcription factor [Clostridium estertheticum]|uniref:response regulator transcription factor n=1 Tax=Clostridium estertheticum TaxID=238834 RepID=UPI001C7D8A17|nr:response regulator transcription factor [Clostridium estertheticum]MBX4264337.1 response regulator transcription factor [Clostridium estertheticum]WLC89181.1 response regulator transcription factor [Clostridium estertheticum]
MYKIMTIEDDKSLRINMNESLIKWGFMTFVINKFEDITAEFASMKPDLVIMDINLPYFDGFYWCGKIRKISKVPIIFVSSRDTNMDIIMAMNTGGDDYITKPFSMDILIAKINALLRRTYSYGEQPSDLVECDGVILNLVDNTLQYKEEKINLTKNEFKVMLLLMKNRGKTISRERIMRGIWDDDNFINDNTLTVNINRLRMKVSDMGLKDYIVTKKGYGYMIL